MFPKIYSNYLFDGIFQVEGVKLETVASKTFKLHST